jgi:D-cysteine desulfhydrase family pyridoxal phosphate-dependent enzyme
MIPAIERLPRVRLGFYPTPITDAQHLSSALGGPHIYIKRDDLSGLAMGGNKCRKLEFIMGFAKDQGYDAVVSTASSQSNFCLQIAAAARKLGMKPSFVLLAGVHTETQGNLLLQNILDSEVEILEFSDMTQLGGPLVTGKMEAAAERLRSKGYKPLIVKHNLPEITAIVGTVGWVNAAEELIQQLADSDIKADYVVLANGGGGTQAGLALGSKYAQANYRVIGVSVLNTREQAQLTTIAQANATAEYLGIKTRIGEDDIEVYGDYVGKGYGIPTEQCIDAIRLVAQTEAIYLDPVYTGKAMAGLIDLTKKGRFKTTDSIIFIHTGGTPAVFAYQREIAR